MVVIESDEIDFLIELRGVYDGWSVAVMKDGSLVNRWADDGGNALPGHERRWRATQDAIDTGSWTGSGSDEEDEWR